MINLPFEIIATNNLNTVLNPFDFYTLPLEDWITNSVDYVVDNYRYIFQAIRFPISITLEGIQWLFLAIPPLLFLILISLLAWQLAGSRIAIFSVIALSLIGFVGAWEEAMVSLSLILTAVAFCMVVGISLGILSASNEKLEKTLQPILDAMQTLPSFVYLVPVVMLFGIGEVSGVIATFIFAVPPLVRLTNLGIKQVSEEVVEAATAFGSTPKQMLWEVQIPLAMPTILAGVNQAILLALSMSVVTSMIGVQGLGGMVLQGLGSVNVGLATVGGLSIVLIAILLDRMTHVIGQSDNQFDWKQKPPISYFFSSSTRYIAIFASTILGVLLITSIWQQFSPNNAAQNTQANTLPGTGIEIKSAHSSSLEERFQTEIVNMALRKLGYKTSEPKQIEYTTMHLALGDGDLDYTPVHGEKLHNNFFEQGGGDDKLERIGVISANLLQGYQIDKKTADKYNINNLGQLKDPKIAKLFDSDGDRKANLTGCNAGWGCQKIIDYQIKAYGLEDTVEHDKGTYQALIADTITRYKQGQPVLYFTWTPMWMGGELKVDQDVIWLEVPYTSLPEELGKFTEKDTTALGKNLGFAIDDIRILANKKFLNENPAAKSLFAQIKIPVDDISQQNQLFKNGENTPEDINRHAQEWVQKNQDQFDSWVEEAKKAAQTNANTSQNKNITKGEIKSAHSSLLEERFQTEIVNMALRKLGYETPEPQQIEYTTMHIALGNGELDYTPVHWEKGHNTFFEKGGGDEKLERVGLISANLVQGYQIDKKTADKYNITNIAQLKDPKIAKLFDSDGDGKANLTGCNAGWGCELAVDHHLKAYELEDTVEHDKGTYSALIADTITRYKQGEPVLYYTWTPYWMASELKVDEDVVWLEVPFTSLPAGNFTEKDTTAFGKNLGFIIDDIRILANQEFLSENPEVKRLFEQIKIPVDDINEQNERLKNGEKSLEDIRRHAREWIKKNQAEFDGWVAEAKKAEQKQSSIAPVNTKSTSQSSQVISAHSTLLEGRFHTEIINIGLRKLGYKTPEPQKLEPTTSHLALGTGDIDYIGVHWEKLHNDFFEKNGGDEKLERVGLISSNLLQGYQIDKKTADKYNITNLEQLKDPKIAKLFDTDGDGKANLTSCNAGWGFSLVIKHQIKAYGLEDTVEEDEGSYIALIADTIARYRQGQPVLYYTWTPHWMANVLKVDQDVVWLEVPYTSLPEAQGNLTAKDTTAMGKNLGFAVDNLKIVANKEFLSKNPTAKRFFEQVKIPVDDINKQNQRLRNGEKSIEDIRGHAQEWIKNHQAEFDSWVAEARKVRNN